MDKQLNVRIDPNVFEELRSYSFHQKLTKKEIVEEALKRFLAAKPQKVK